MAFSFGGSEWVEFDVGSVKRLERLLELVDWLCNTNKLPGPKASGVAQPISRA